jgi:NTE family protein
MRLAIVLMGGGARAAYQAGVLKGLAEIAREVRPGLASIPFSIICGTSAGAINATALGVYADDFSYGARRIEEVWGAFHVPQVYRSDWPGVIASGARWLSALTFGWAVRRSPRALLDNTPLAELLREQIDFARLVPMLKSRYLHAVAVTALSYSSGQHLTFYQADQPMEAWRRAQRAARPVYLGPEHLLASSAIPLMFQAVPLPFDGRIEYFGDGAIRQVAPLSPAIHFGAQKILVIGAAAPNPEVPIETGQTPSYPSLAQIGQQVMASIFLDSLGADIERIRHVNQIVHNLPRAVDADSGWRAVEVEAIAPSERIELIAARHLHRLPLAIRGLLGAVGADRARGAAFASYLLFEADYTRELIALGYRDAMERRETLSAFVAAAENGGAQPGPKRPADAGTARPA